MPGHPVDVVVDELVRAAVRVAPALEEPLRLLSHGDRLPASRALAVAASSAADRDVAAVAAAFARLSRLLALVGLPDGGARQMVQLAGSAGEVDTDLATTLQAISEISPVSADVRVLCELAALAVPTLLQWQAMLPPNNPWSGAHSPAVLQQVTLAGASLVASAGTLDPRTAQLARLWVADIDRRAGRREQALATAQDVESQAADEEVRGYVHLLRGDWAAAPLSSPAVWNCSLQPVLGTDGSIGGLEDREGAVGLDLDAAATSWDRAAELLRGPVWSAHLDLRRVVAKPGLRRRPAGGRAVRGGPGRLSRHRPARRGRRGHDPPRARPPRGRAPARRHRGKPPTPPPSRVTGSAARPASGSRSSARG